VAMPTNSSLWAGVMRTFGQVNYGIYRTNVPTGFWATRGFVGKWLN
jgi:hypothetical protein